LVLGGRSEEQGVGCRAHLQVLHRILVRGDQVAFEPRCQFLTTQQLIAPILSVIAIPVTIVIPTRIIPVPVVGGSSATASSILVVLVVAIAIVSSAATALIAIPVAIASIVVLAIVAVSVTIARSEPEIV